MGVSCSRGSPPLDIVPHISQGMLLHEKLVELPHPQKRSTKKVTSFSSAASDAAASKEGGGSSSNRMGSRRRRRLRARQGETEQERRRRRDKLLAPPPSYGPPPSVTEWLELRDPASDRIYYHNRVTGKSQWDKPAGFDVAVEVAAEEERSRGTFWIEVNDTRGRTYYYDLFTRTTRWDKPPTFVAPKKRSEFLKDLEVL